MDRPGYMMIKEAAAQYRVSRAKIHRLIQVGRLPTTKDPRDERVTLLKTEDLEALFRFPEEEVEEMGSEAARTEEIAGGRLTAELAARMDAVRKSVARGRKFSDSVEIIREEREKRARQVDEAVLGSRAKRHDDRAP